MKKFALICLFATLAFAAGAQNEEQREVPANGAKIRFEELEHQYGTIQKGGNGVCQFVFWNDGNEPLILQNVKASCGCTTPSYTQKPVMPGQSGVIEVKYNTNNVGGFSKTVTVTSNAVDNPRVQLRIRGNVVDGNQQAQPQQARPAQPQAQPQPQMQAQPQPVQPVKAKPAPARTTGNATAVPATARPEGPAPVK